MGWRGNLRSGLAAVRRLERAETRRINEAARQYKAMQKQEAFENGQRAVQEYNDYIELISSTHKDTSEKIDWHEILNAPAPGKPEKADRHQQAARVKSENYKPSMLDKFLGSSNTKKSKLEQDIELAASKDQQQYEEELRQYQEEMKEWSSNQELAKGVLALDPVAYKGVIDYLDPFSDIKEIGSGIKLDYEKNHVVITLNANGITVIPDFTLTQTSTGKVSKKKMPVTRFNEMYQDYICGCVLRAAREIFSFLPVEFVFVHVMSELVDSATGHLEPQPILSVAIPRMTLERLNFSAIDPSNSMQNFKHNMKFSKTNGFNIVSKLSPETILSARPGDQ